MKKILMSLLCVGMLVGCSSKQEKISYLNKIQQSFSIEEEKSESGTKFVRVEDKQENGFMYYISIKGEETVLASFLGLKEKEMVFYTLNEYDGQDAYYIKGDKPVVVAGDTSTEELKNKMNDVLKQHKTSLEEIEKACEEFLEKQSK